LIAYGWIITCKVSNCIHVIVGDKKNISRPEAQRNLTKQKNVHK